MTREMHLSNIICTSLRFFFAFTLLRFAAHWGINCEFDHELNLRFEFSLRSSGRRPSCVHPLPWIWRAHIKDAQLQGRGSDETKRFQRP